MIQSLEGKSVRLPNRAHAHGRPLDPKVDSFKHLGLVPFRLDDYQIVTFPEGWSCETTDRICTFRCNGTVVFYMCGEAPQSICFHNTKQTDSGAPPKFANGAGLTPMDVLPDESDPEDPMKILEYAELILHGVADMKVRS